MIFVNNSWKSIKNFIRWDIFYSNILILNFKQYQYFPIFLCSLSICTSFHLHHQNPNLQKLVILLHLMNLIIFILKCCVIIAINLLKAYKTYITSDCHKCNIHQILNQQKINLATKDHTMMTWDLAQIYSIIMSLE